MIIVVDGPDGCGKSTLAKRLAHELDFEYRHTWQPPCTDGNPFKHYLDILIKYMMEDVVLDRGVLDELVYPKILNRPTNVTKKGAQSLTDLAKLNGGTTIICLPLWEACRDNWRKNWHTEFLRSEVHLFQSWDLFKQIQEEFHLIRFSYTEETIENFLKYTLYKELKI